MVVETALRDPAINDSDASALIAHVAYLRRNHKWDAKKGRWIAKKEEQVERETRKCICGCELDLPRSRNRKARFLNDAHKMKWHRAQKRKAKDEARAKHLAERRAERRAKVAARAKV